jgi:hypothetical protein
MHNAEETVTVYIPPEWVQDARGRAGLTTKRNSQLRTLACSGSAWDASEGH